MDYFEGFVYWIVPKIMESPQPKTILDQLDKELKLNLPLQSAQLYRDVVKLISESKKDLPTIALLKQQLQNKLCAIHETSPQADKERLVSMKEIIFNTHKSIIAELNKLSKTYFFSTPYSDFEIQLSKFIKEKVENYVAFEANVTCRPV